MPFLSFPGTICIHLPCVCRKLELEPVMLHGIFFTFWHVHLPFCTVVALLLALQPLVLQGICYILVVVQRSCGFLYGSLGCHSGSRWGIFRVSFGFHLRFSLRVTPGKEIVRVPFRISFGCHLASLGYL